ncbi:hypothetical protein [Streptomyces katsurahamanus]|uniref:Beta/gamma crystallin family protein n=1 Tax=Streptomyces katsurahamanus TaxID=2577098 RepID=A0ABW9NN54_9ACTN|nr:hypothetical protein [Streptomyces katsurahamanus]MQS34737.1 hypothetical protein [Streptomyces katsurahamanus]
MVFTRFRSAGAAAVAAGIAMALALSGTANAADAEPRAISVGDGLIHVATAWEHPFFEGQALYFYAQDCRTAGSQILDSLPEGWNDRISSLQTYSQCSMRLYEHYNRQGLYTWVNANERKLTFFSIDNNTSSVMFLAPR